MEELLELKKLIYKQDFQNALLLIDEIEEMSKEDKINKIYSYCIILLVHLIKQSAEMRSTRSWQVSIDLAVDRIQRTNKRRKAGGTYVDIPEVKEILEQAYRIAMKEASLEAFGGVHESETLAGMVNSATIIDQAIILIQNYN